MKNWLENNFRLVIEFDEEKEEIEMIEWDLDDGRKRRVSITFVIKKFGDSTPQGREDMLFRCPTEGWKENIMRWDELGLLM